MADVVESARIDELLDEYGGYAEDIKLGRVYGTCLVGEFVAILQAARISQAGAGGGVVREALEAAFDFLGSVDGATAVREQILSALAPGPSAGKPVAWQGRGDGGDWEVIADPDWYRERGWQVRPLYATPPATPVQPTASVEAMAWRDVIAERHRQVEDEGWVPEHDDEHSRGEMARAAACYADPVNIERETPPARWPWDEQWWKPAGQRRMLVKAGALIIAEIERLDRKNGLASLTPAPTQGDGGKADRARKIIHEYVGQAASAATSGLSVDDLEGIADDLFAALFEDTSEAQEPCGCLTPKPYDSKASEARCPICDGAPTPSAPVSAPATDGEARPLHSYRERGQCNCASCLRIRRDAEERRAALSNPAPGHGEGGL